MIRETRFYTSITLNGLEMLFDTDYPYEHISTESFPESNREILALALHSIQQGANPYLFYEGLILKPTKIEDTNGYTISDDAILEWGGDLIKASEILEQMNNYKP